MSTQIKPQTDKPKPPTPVTDSALTEEVRRLEGYTMMLHTELQKLNATIEESHASRARDVAKGVFFGSLATGLLVFVISFILPV